MAHVACTMQVNCISCVHCPMCKQMIWVAAIAHLGMRESVSEGSRDRAAVTLVSLLIPPL